jgi:hypothetical protein
VRNEATTIHVVIYTQETGIMKIIDHSKKKSLIQKSNIKEVIWRKWQSLYSAKRNKIFLAIVETGKQGNKE